MCNDFATDLINSAMHKVSVVGLYVHGYHGCHPMERKTGGDFEVDVHVHKDFTAAAVSEKLNETVDYVTLMNLVEEQMKIRCDLIESVAHNIAHEVKARFEGVGKVEVSVRKLHPPVRQKVDHVSVTYILD